MPVAGRTTPNTIAVLVHDSEDPVLICGHEAAKRDASLAYLRSLCVDREHSSPQPGAFLSLRQLRYRSEAA